MNSRKLDQWVKGVRKKWRGVEAAQSSQIRAIAGYVNGKPASQRRRLQRFVAQPRTVKGC